MPNNGKPPPYIDARSRRKSSDTKPNRIPPIRPGWTGQPRPKSTKKGHRVADVVCSVVGLAAVIVVILLVRNVRLGLSFTEFWHALVAVAAAVILILTAVSRLLRRDALNKWVGKPLEALALVVAALVLGGSFSIHALNEAKYTSLVTICHSPTDPVSIAKFEVSTTAGVLRLHNPIFNGGPTSSKAAYAVMKEGGYYRFTYQGLNIPVLDRIPNVSVIQTLAPSVHQPVCKPGPE